MFQLCFRFVAIAGELWSKQKEKRKDLSPDLGILDDKVRKCIIVHTLCLFLGGDCN